MGHFTIFSAAVGMLTWILNTAVGDLSLFTLLGEKNEAKQSLSQFLCGLFIYLILDL